MNEIWIENVARHLGSELGVMTGVARLFVDDNWTFFESLFAQGLQPETAAHEVAGVLR